MIYFWIIITGLMILFTGSALTYAVKQPEWVRTTNATSDVVAFAIIAPITVGLIMNLVL